MRTLRFGMVGGGIGSFIGDVHRRGAQMDDLAVLTAGCFSRHAEKNRETGEQWHVSADRLYADYREMAEKESARADGIDFVVIATPNQTHFPIAKLFLERGIHVSCDKPVAMNVQEAKELEELAKKRGLHFGVSYTYVNYPMVHQMRGMIERGEIGTILTVAAEYPQDWVINGLERGVPATLWASQVAIGHECSISIRVFGDKGSLEWTHDQPTRLKVTKANGPEIYYTNGRTFLTERAQRMSRIAAGHPEGFFEAFGNYYRGFCHDILHRMGEEVPQLPHPTITDGIKSMQFVDACVKSNANGNCWISIEK